MKLSRRQFLLGSGAAATIVAADALCIEPRWLRVTEHNVAVARLPKMLDGYRIAQISDAHLRHMGAVEERIVQEIQKTNVDLVFLTGDIIDESTPLKVLDELCSSLRGVDRKIVAMLGNWEHWAGVPIPALKERYRSHGINLLMNESERIESVIAVAATDDHTSGHFSLKRTMRTFTAGAVNLFLTHSPGVLDEVPETAGRFDLVLAGHTHGGQGRIGPFAPIRPPGCGRFLSGWYDVSIGRAYVSCGTGMSVIPARFDCRPELPIFSLRQR